MLEEFLGRDVTAPIYGKGWVDLMIDVDRDTSGKAVNERRAHFGERMFSFTPKRRGPDRDLMRAV